MTEHADRAAMRPRRRPVRATLRFLSRPRPLVVAIGAVVGLILVTVVAIRAMTGDGGGFF
jgi:hypothetical protein